MGTTDEERSRHTARVLDRGGLEEGLAVECDVCGLIATVVTGEEAEAVARLHEKFIAVLVKRWQIPH